VSNVFPERLDNKVVCIQSDRSLQLQSVPPMLPADVIGYDHSSSLFFLIIPSTMPIFFTSITVNGMLLRLEGFQIELVKVLICPSKYRSRTVVPRSPSSGDSVSCSL